MIPFVIIPHTNYFPINSPATPGLPYTTPGLPYADTQVTHDAFCEVQVTSLSRLPYALETPYFDEVHLAYSWITLNHSSVTLLTHLDYPVAYSWITLDHSSVTLLTLGLPRSTLWLPYVFLVSISCGSFPGGLPCDGPTPRVDCLPSRLRGLSRREKERKKKSNFTPRAYTSGLPYARIFLLLIIPHSLP